MDIFGKVVNGQALGDLISNLSELVEVKLTCVHPIDTELIAQIIVDHKNLRRIQFSFNGFDAMFDNATITELNLFREQFERNWHIEDMSNAYILEKKN